MNPVRVGEYDKRITIESITTRVNDDGSPIEVATEFAKRWAKVVPSQGREYVQADSIMADVTTVLEMRFLDGVTARHRVRLRGRVLEIVGAENIQEQSRVTRLYCKEKVN